MNFGLVKTFDHLPSLQAIKISSLFHVSSGYLSDHQGENVIGFTLSSSD
jgi:hypothetical protein